MAKNDLQSIFSTNLKNYRIKAGLSQMKLAELADLSVGFVCDLESGRRWGTPETFAKLAKALDVEPFELLLPKSEKPDEDSSTMAVLSSVKHSLKDKLSQILLNAIDDTIDFK